MRNKERFTGAAASGSNGLSPTLMVGGLAVLLLAVLVVVVWTRGSGAGGGTALAAGGDVILAAAEFDDGQARFYRYATATGRQVRFFVMKSGDGVIRAAFDACDVCFRERQGYRQQGSQMICNNCGQSFRSTDINVLQGGCNPAPLDRTVEGGHVILRAAAIEAGSWYF
jgi:uncharacterized membrane protein